MKRTLTIYVCFFLCVNSVLIANPPHNGFHKNISGKSGLESRIYRGLTYYRNNYASFTSFGSLKKNYSNRLFVSTVNRKHFSSTIYKRTNGKDEIVKHNLVYFTSPTAAYSFFKSINNKNRFLIKYTRSDKGLFQYKFHIEGCVKIYEGSNNSEHTYTYVSMNSAITPEKYIIVPVNKEGRFSYDIEDDSIGSISIIKRGSEDKIIPLKTIDIEKTNAYSFDLNKNTVEVLAKTSKKDKAAKTNRVDIMATNTAKVYFDLNNSTLKVGTKQMLDNLIYGLNQMNNLTGTILEINGYADIKGSKAYNFYISKMRSLACKKYLENHGLKNVKIKINAMGSISAFNETSDNNEALYDNGEKDRRVDLIVHNPQESIALL